MAEIELQRVNNVKSKSSLTAIKHFSTSFPLHSRPVQQTCCVQTRLVLLDGEMFSPPSCPLSPSNMELKLPVALDQKATDRGEACVLQAACKHTIRAWPRLSGEVGGRCVCVSLTEAEVTTSPGQTTLPHVQSWHLEFMSLHSLCWFPLGLSPCHYHTPSSMSQAAPLPSIYG